MYPTFSVASQDIILKVVEPDPISQQSLCPNQRVVYKCGVVVTSFELSWTLVDKCSLKFTALSNTSDTDSKCDGKFNATLTHKRDISDDQTDGYLFNSTLEIFPPLSNSNGSVLMCTGGTVSKQVKDNATITLSGEYMQLCTTFSLLHYTCVPVYQVIVELWQAEKYRIV